MIKTLTQEIVRELLDYDPATGILTWKHRPLKYCANKNAWSIWNNRFAGKEAFTSTDKRGRKNGAILQEYCRAHQVIWLWMTGKIALNVDHEDGNTSNNRWKNLRNVTHTVNMKNKSRNKNNTSGVTGVRKNENGTFYASINAGSKRISLGNFETLAEAASARKNAEREYNYHPNHGRDQ